jgi:hypothetical protein
VRLSAIDLLDLISSFRLTCSVHPVATSLSPGVTGKSSTGVGLDSRPTGSDSDGVWCMAEEVEPRERVWTSATATGL